MNNKQLETTLLTIKNYVDTTTMNHFVHTAAVDVNTLKTTGIYSLTSNCTNNATTNAGTLIVDFNIGTPYQLWIPDNTHAFYKRNWDKTNSVWKSWSNKITGSITGNADGNAGTATKLKTARTIALTGDATGSTSFDGSGNVNIEVSIDGAGNAGSANKVNNPMTIQLNSGTTEGTNKFTFDGSAAKSVNITPSSIGAAASSHGTHVTYATNAPKANGTAAVGTVNRVAREDHVHPLQTTVSGNAGSATKLATARTISLAGDASGEATFDGTEDVQITVEVKNDSHSHSNYVTKSGATMSGDLTISKSGARYVSTNGTNSMWTGINSGGTTIGMYDQTGEKYIVSKNLETGAVTLAGNADTASKLASERTISLGGDLTGSVNFDGSKNVTLTANVANDSHTHKYAGSSSAGGAATSANKVNKSLKVQLNGGTTEGTNQYTFDGSTATTINITPSSIGAATASHGTHLTLGTGAGNAYYGDKGNIAYTHSQEAHAPVDAQKNSDITKSEIEAKLTGDITKHYHTVLTMKTDNFKDASALPSTYPRGESLFFSNNLTENKFKGLTYGLVQTLKHYGSGPAATQWLYPYNDNKNKIFVRQAFYNTDAWEEWAEVYTSLNKPTPASIGTYTNTEIETKLSGKSNTGHTHNYAGSSTPGGAATSANKVNKSLTLQFNGTTNATFDGSSAKTVNITPSAIGAYTKGEVDKKVSSINSTASTNLAAAKAYADEKIAALVDSAPDAMNTLNELAEAISSHQSVYDSYVTTVTNALNGKAPTSHASTGTSYGVASASNYGHAKASGTTPKANGTAAVGSETGTFARGDHVHPLQTTVSGNAGSANKVNNNLVVKLNGGSTEGTNMYTFNGSAGKTVNITPNGIGAANGSTKAATTAATAGWYRIAQTKADIQNVIGLFVIRGQVNSHHTSAIITAGITYGKNPTLNQLAYTTYGTGLTKARIVYHSTYSGNYAYLEVYLAQAAATTITVDLLSNLGWTLVSPSTAGSVPSGYTNTEITFVVNKIVASIKGSLEGNASTASKLSSKRNIALTGDVTGNADFDGSGNISITTTVSNDSHEHSAEKITSGTLSANRLATSGVTAGNYGPSANATPGYGSTFDVPYITVDNKGRVTAASTKTVKIPALGESSSTAYRGDRGKTAYDHSQKPHAPADAQKNSEITKAEINAKLTGAITAHYHTQLGAIDLSSKTASLNDYVIKTGNVKVQRYFCPTDGNGSNITGRPNDSSKQAFILIVESIRSVSDSDYICKQTYIQGSTKQTHVRYCTNGTWSAWEKVYTSVQKPTLSELGAAASSHTHDDRYYTETEINTKLNGKSDTNHTHSYAGSSSAGGAANSVANSLKIQLNGGTSEGNTQYTFNGSSGKTVNITASKVGAVSTAGGSTISVSAFGTALTIQRNDENAASITFKNSNGILGFIGMTNAINSGLYRWKGNDTNTKYLFLDEGNYKTIVTPANIGAAAASHTHNYAGSSSAGGAANSVKTNLVIKLNSGSTEGTNLFTFNGSTGKTINITPSAIGAAAADHGTHLTLGETSSTAYRGDRGKIAYNHSQAAHAPSNAQKNSDITKAEIEAKLTGKITSHHHLTDSEVTTSLTNAFGASYIPTK